jgi:hypothetical protein
MLGWLVYEQGIEPHLTVFDKSPRSNRPEPPKNGQADTGTKAQAGIRAEGPAIDRAVSAPSSIYFKLSSDFFSRIGPERRLLRNSSRPEIQGQADIAQNIPNRSFVTQSGHRRPQPNKLSGLSPIVLALTRCRSSTRITC